MIEFQIVKIEEKHIEKAISFITNIFGPSFKSEARYEIPASLEENVDQRTTFIALSPQNTIIGTAQIVVSYMHTDTYNLTWVATDPAFQKQGIGRMLAKHCERYIGDIFLKGAPGSIVVVDYTRKKNKNSMFYKNLGYETGPLTHNGLPLMIKRLNTAQI